MSAVVRPGPDPERDARVAARRAEDARKASRALDRLLAEAPPRVAVGLAYHEGWADGYRASEEHHKRHYGVVSCPVNGGECGLCAAGGKCLYGGEPGVPLMGGPDE